MKRNVTISLGQRIIQKAKILAARRATSISGLVTAQIEALVGQDEAYETAKRQALDILAHGFHLGGGSHVTRAGLHDR